MTGEGGSRVIRGAQHATAATLPGMQGDDEGLLWAGVEPESVEGLDGALLEEKRRRR